jgi:hypothetical protein
VSAHAELLRNLPEEPEVEVAITTGTEHWRTGEIELRVRGDGEVVVRQRRAGEEREYDGRLDPERLRRLGAELAGDRIDELRDSGGARKPDDHPVRIRIARNGETLHEGAIRHSDRWKDERLDRLVRTYDALVGELTDGVLPYGRPG